MSIMLRPRITLPSTNARRLCCLWVSLFLAACSEEGGANRDDGIMSAPSVGDTMGSETAGSDSSVPGSSSPGPVVPSSVVPPASVSGTTPSTSAPSGSGTLVPTASTLPSVPPSATSSDGMGGEGGTGVGGGGAGGTGATATGGDGGDGPSGGGSGTSGTGSGGQAGSAGAAGGGAAGAGPEPAGFMPCPTNGDPCAILPLGDSITEGCCSFSGGYRVELFRRAVQDGKNITYVGALSNGPNDVDGQPFPRRHEGHGGYTIDSDAGHNGISGQITDSALSMFGPHIVLLMIGTNDLNGNVDVNNAPTRLDNLIGDIVTAAPDTLVVVASIIPMVNGNDAKVGPYNDAIVSLVESRAALGQHVVFVDNWAAFTADSNYANVWMSDTLHPNDAGYAVLGASFYEAILEYLP